MLLTPHEILKHLGFDVPGEGVRINPNDAYMHATVLQLVGRTMNTEAIPQSELEQMHAGLAGLVATWRNEEPSPITDTSVFKLRTTVKTILSDTFKYRKS